MKEDDTIKDGKRRYVLFSFVRIGKIAYKLENF